jgi:hypothetical protein
VDTQTLSAIAAAAAAVVSIVAAYLSKRSADRSAAAEERSATASEKALAIEEERLAHEREDRARATAPHVDVGETHGLLWVVAQQRTALVGFIENQGPGSAVIEGATLDEPNGPTIFNPVGESWEVVLPENGHLQVQAEWPVSDFAGRPVVTVIYRAAQSSYRAEARYTLLRSGSDRNGQPQYRQGEMRVRRIPNRARPD